MSTELMLANGRRRLSPQVSDFVTQVTDLSKLAVVQSLASAAAPATLTVPRTRVVGHRERRNMGAVVTDYLTNRAPTGKRAVDASMSGSPLSRLYSAELRRLGRTYSVDLTTNVEVFAQVPRARFGFIAGEFAPSVRRDQARADLFDMHVAAAESSTLVDGHESLQPDTIGDALDPTVALMLSDRVLGPVSTVTNDSSVGTSTPTATISYNRGLEFRIHKVRCYAETTPTWPGHDRIAIGGTAIDPDGSGDKIGESQLSTKFGDGDSKTYSPPRVFHRFSLEDIDYSADFAVVLGLAEKDNGGFSGFLNELWKSIREQVEEIILGLAKNAGTAIDASPAGSIVDGGSIGSLIGAVAIEVLNGVVEWIIRVVKDDIFRPQMAAISLGHSVATFGGGATTSPVMYLDFEDHGGHYRVDYSWRLRR